MFNFAKYLDPKWQFMIYRNALDDVPDEPWSCAETEEDAQRMVDAETEAYDHPDYSFHYRRIYR